MGGELGIVWWDGVRLGMVRVSGLALEMRKNGCVESRGKLGSVTHGVEGSVISVVRVSGSKRPKKSLSTIRVLATLCFSRVGVSPGGYGVRSESEFILSGKRTTPMLCTALTRGKCFSERRLGKLEGVGEVLRKRPSVGKAPKIRVSAKSLKRNFSITYNVTVTSGLSGTP